MEERVREQVDTRGWHNGGAQGSMPGIEERANAREFRHSRSGDAHPEKASLRVEARTSRPPSGTRQILPSGFCAPHNRNPLAGLAPQAPFRKFRGSLGLAIVLGIVLGAGAIFALGGLL